MKPKKREENMDYERVKIDDFIEGVIEEIQRDEEHKTVWQGQEKVRDCIRFKFKLKGYEYNHFSRWLTFAYGELTNLYKKYLVSLVEGVYPDCDFDITELKGMEVKTLWSEKNYGENKVFQFIETIRPVKEKLKYKGIPEQSVIDLGAEENKEEPSNDDLEYFNNLDLGSSNG